MNKIQINRFIKRAYPHTNVPVKYFRDHHTSHVAGVMSDSDAPKTNTLLINSAHIKQSFREDIEGNDFSYFKGVLLHELGHFDHSLKDKVRIGKTYINFYKCRAFQRELYAHVFAIKRSEKLKMPMVKRALLHQLLDCGMHRWDYAPSYGLAYKWYLKNKSLVKRYGKAMKRIKKKGADAFYKHVTK